MTPVNLISLARRLSPYREGAPERREGASPPPVAMRRVHAHGSKTAAEISPNIGMGPVLPARRVSPKARRASHSKTSPVLQTLLNWIGPGARLVPRSRRGRSPSPMTTQNTGVGPVSPGKGASDDLDQRKAVTTPCPAPVRTANPTGAAFPMPSTFLPDWRAGVPVCVSLPEPARLFCKRATTRKADIPICSIPAHSFHAPHIGMEGFAYVSKTSCDGGRHV